jgi:hypothetical protein
MGDAAVFERAKTPRPVSCFDDVTGGTQINPHTGGGKDAARPTRRLCGAARMFLISTLRQLRVHNSLSSGSSVMKLTFIRSQSLRAGSRSYSTATRLPAEPCLLRVRERAGRCLGKIGARGQQRAPPEQPKSENEKCKSDWQTRIYRADK